MYLNGLTPNTIFCLFAKYEFLRYKMVSGGAQSRRAQRDVQSFGRNKGKAGNSIKRQLFLTLIDDYCSEACRFLQTSKGQGLSVSTGAVEVVGAYVRHLSNAPIEYLVVHLQNMRTV
jgi:hypothetical protein